MIDSFVLIIGVIGPANYLLLVEPSYLMENSNFKQCCINYMSFKQHYRLFILIHLWIKFNASNLVVYFHLKKLKYSFFFIVTNQLVIFVTRAYYYTTNFIMVCFQPG